MQVRTQLKQTKQLLKEALGQVTGGGSSSAAGGSSSEGPPSRPGSAGASASAAPMPAAAAPAPAPPARAPLAPPPGMPAQPMLPPPGAGRGRGAVGAYNPLAAAAGARPAYNPLAAMQQQPPQQRQQQPIMPQQFIPGYTPPAAAAATPAAAARGPGALPAMAPPGGRGRGAGGYRPPGIAYQPMPPGYPPQQQQPRPPYGYQQQQQQPAVPSYGTPQYAAWLRQQQQQAAAAAALRAPPPPPAGAASSVKWEAPAMPQTYAQVRLWDCTNGGLALCCSSSKGHCWGAGLSLGWCPAGCCEIQYNAHCLYVCLLATSCRRSLSRLR